MNKWNLTSQDPGTFIIASDQRCGSTIYEDDHIWELVLSGGEPPALAIQTTFGLRASSYRIFPRFVQGDTAVVETASFFKTPSVEKFYPNFLEVSYSPFEGIDVTNEYWVPNSFSLLCRMKITNSRLTIRKLVVQWASLLAPISEGQRMAHQEIDNTMFLCGHTANLYPVILMTGGPVINIGPFPALSIETELAPGSSRKLIWAQVAQENPDRSFELARSIANQHTMNNWDGEIARLDILNQSMVQIVTGDQDWNTAFALTQNVALGLCLSPTSQLPNASFVSSRLPDDGFSVRGDGSDHDHFWDGQSALEAYFLAGLLLPSYPEIIEGILNNFIFTQTQSGFIDCKPGLAGQRSGFMVTPILTKLAYQLYEITEDRSFLETVYPALRRYLLAWFKEQQDRDGDGIPEWTWTSQSGFEDHPVFTQYQPWAQGADISKIESPSLCSFLYSEIQTLQKMAKILQVGSQSSALEALAENLYRALDSSWDNEYSIYRNWDRDSHLSPVREHLGQLSGPGSILLNREFNIPVRLTLRINAGTDIPRSINIFIHGTSPAGNFRIERIKEEQIRWQLSQGNVCTERIFNFIESIEITGTQQSDLITVEIMDLSSLDQTLLLPLWAGIPSQKQANQLVLTNISSPTHFWSPHGIKACVDSGHQSHHPCDMIHMIWNDLIGEGLLHYGFRQEAAELVSKLMNIVIQNLKTSKAFYNYYHAGTGQGRGERNSLGGLAPLHLFLETLGVRIYSPTKIWISGKNPFQWPVTIQYRGLTILRDFHRTNIIFPGGQSAIIKSEEPRLIKLDNN